MAMGSHGVISVTANVAPGPMARMCAAAFAGDWPAALTINRRLLPLHLKLFVEANPIPVKWALAQMGRIGDAIRLPLMLLSAPHHETVRAALVASGVLVPMSAHVFQLRTTRPVGVVAASLLFAVLSGCGLGEKLADAGKVDYKSTAQARKSTLEVPPDLVSPRADDRFVIDRTRTAPPPPISRDRTSGRRPPPDPGAARGARCAARAIRQPALARDRPAAQALWPTIKAFWQDSGFTIDIDRPEAGVIETDWAENRAKLPQDFIRETLGKVLSPIDSTGERDRFRTRLERAGNSTEVYITHRVWPRRPTRPTGSPRSRRRGPMILTSRPSSSGDCVAVGSRPRRSPGRSSMPSRPMAPRRRARGLRPVPGDSRPAGPGSLSAAEGRRIELDEPFDRAWRRVGLALDRGGFTVEDRDRSPGQYFVRYIDPDAEARSSGKQGFFARHVLVQQQAAGQQQPAVPRERGRHRRDDPRRRGLARMASP
jgi:outer membrane protein assembly factor BamC